MTNIQAAVGCAQLERLDEFVARKRAIRGFYDEAFADLPGVSSFPVADYTESSCWFSGLVFDKGGIVKLHAIEAKLRDQGVDTRTFWKPVHLQQPYLEAPCADSLVISEGLWDRILTIPCSTGITDEELGKVVDVITDIIQKGL